MMDDVSEWYLIHLRDAGVDVMFRPLHEMNQGRFWRSWIWTLNIQDFDTLAQDAIHHKTFGCQYWEVATLDVYEGFQT
jgi:mannan endo-1,4-beta-mannosidase